MLLLIRRSGQLPESVNLLLPETVHRRAVRSDAGLRVEESVLVIDDSDVFEIIEKDNSSEVPLLAFIDGLHHQVELAGRSPFHENPVLVQNSPEETGTIEALHTGRAPDVGPSEVSLDRGLHS